MVFRRLINSRNINAIRSYCKDESPQINFTDFRILNSSTLRNAVLPKDHTIFKAIGATEELLSFIGLAREYAQESDHEYVDKLKRIQTVIIDISTAISRSGESNISISSSHITELDTWMIEYSKELPPPEQYIIPGGGIASASLHTARSICRRAERNLVPLVRDGLLRQEPSIYLNKLSDFLLTLSRIAAKVDKRTESIYIQKPDGKVQVQ